MPPVTPRALGRRVFKNFDLAEIAQYIDWGPFFQTWDLAGPYPAILDDEIVGVEARKVLADAQAMLKKIIEGRWLQANGVMGLFPANRVGDDIEFYTDESRSRSADDLVRPAPANRKAGGGWRDAPQPLLGRLCGPQGQRHRRLRRPVCRDRRYWRREERQGI